jgi:hypothetical protein
VKIRNVKMRCALLLFLGMVTAWEGAAAQGELGGEGWGYKFDPVMGWKHVGTEDALIVLGHDTLPGMVFVYPHQETDMAGLKNQMLKGVQEQDLQLKPSSPLQKLGNNAFVADYAGVSGNERAKARGIGNLSPYGGGGAYIFAVTTSEKYTKAYASVAEAIAKNMRFLKIDTARLVQKFAHRWTHLSSSGYRQTDLYFYPDGRYADSFEASYGGQSTDEFGHQDGHWGAVGTEQGQGHWKVRGNFRRGQIIVTKGDGAETVLNYEVNVQDGETYWGEYLFNGEKYFINDKGIYGTD